MGLTIIKLMSIRCVMTSQYHGLWVPIAPDHQVLTLALENLSQFPLVIVVPEVYVVTWFERLEIALLNGLGGLLVHWGCFRFIFILYINGLYRLMRGLIFGNSSVQ
jgi:hypothetical protein